MTEYRFSDDDAHVIYPTPSLPCFLSGVKGDPGALGPTGPQGTVPLSLNTLDTESHINSFRT